MRYTDRDQAIAHYIIPTLDNPADYNADAIFGAAFTYVTDENARGEEVLTRAGFEMTLTDEGYWDAVLDAQNP